LCEECESCPREDNRPRQIKGIQGESISPSTDEIGTFVKRCGDRRAIESAVPMKEIIYSFTFPEGPEIEMKETNLLVVFLTRIFLISIDADD
jgi:hypothetical protein